MKRAPRDARYYLKCLFPWTRQTIFIHYYETQIADCEAEIYRGVTWLITAPYDDVWNTEKKILQHSINECLRLNERLAEIYELQPWIIIS